MYCCESFCLVTCFEASVICGPNQLCAGLQCGIESTIHVMNEMANKFHLNHNYLTNLYNYEKTLAANSH